MTQNDPDVTSTIRALDVIFTGAEQAPIYAPNVGRAVAANGSLYIDLGFVDPFDALAIGIQHGTDPAMAKITAHTLVRLSLSTRMADQLLNLISTQIEMAKQGAKNEAANGED